MKRFTKIAVAAIAAAALAACALVAGCGKQETVVVSDFEYGTVSQTGGKIMVSLDENPSTGYVWIATADGSPVAIEEVPGDFSAPSDVVGAPSLHIFQLTPTVKDGSIMVTFDQMRSWEDAPIATVVLKAVVEKGQINNVSVEVL